MKKIILIVTSIILIITLVFLVFRTKNDEPYFNQVNLSQYNIIGNSTPFTFYDTILSVGLDEVGLSGVVVTIYPLSDAAKDNSKISELKAHVRFVNGMFYLFIDELNKQEAIRVISHEIIHIEQYFSKRLIYEDGKIFWENNEYQLDNIDYEVRPWENEAFKKEGPLTSKVSNVLIKKN